MKLQLTTLISELEKDMFRNYGIREVEFVEFSKPHQYAVVLDEHGGKWCVHPESLTGWPEGMHVPGVQ